MKKYVITVNGHRYEVEVEETGCTPTASPVQPPSPASPSVAELPQTKTAPAQPKAANAGKKGDLAPGAKTIMAPMPGKVVSLHVKEGQAVQPDQLVLVLEAMKMQNEIFCPAVGVVTEIRTSEGATVNAGDILVVLG